MVEKVQARFFCIPISDIVEDENKIKKLHVKSKKGMKKIKVQKSKKGEIETLEYKALAELTTVEKYKALALLEEGVLLEDIDVDPLIARLGTFGTVCKFTHEGIDYIIVRAAIPRKVQRDIQQALGVGLTPEAITGLGIEDSYCGNTYEELFATILIRFNLNLSGTYDTGSIDEEGKPIMAPCVVQVKIAGE